MIVVLATGNLRTFQAQIVKSNKNVRSASSPKLEVFIKKRECRRELPVMHFLTNEIFMCCLLHISGLTEASDTVMIRLRFLYRFFVAVVLIIGAFSTFMVLKSKHLVRQYYHEQQGNNGDKQSCSCPICSGDPSRTLSEDIRLSTINIARPSSDRGLSQPITPEHQSNPDLHPTTQTEKRRSLVIFGDDRSGTTFLTRLFSEDPNIFSVYEPLWITRSWSKTESGRNPIKDVTNVVSALVSCHFVDNPVGLKFLAKTSKNWAPGLFKNPFLSPPICNKSNEEALSCPDPATIPKVVEEVCSRYFKHSVTKVALVRVPERKLSNIFPQIIDENPDTEVKLLHVIRDPRGSLNSRIKIGWIADYPAPSLARQARGTCEGVTQNVKYAASLEGSLKQHYKMVRYKDIALSPVKTAQEIYKFAGFEMPESLIPWILQATNPSKESLEVESKHAFSSVRNATATVEKWRKEAPIERTRSIERECSELFDLLGLERLT